MSVRPLSERREAVQARWTVGLRLWQQRLKEYCLMDSAMGKRAVAVAGLTLGFLFWSLGRRDTGLRYLTRVHRSNFWAVADRIVEAFLRRPPQGQVTTRQARIRRVYDQHIATYSRSEGPARLFDNPEALLGSRVLVLKSPGDNEKGAILVDYNFALPLFARFFDVPAIARRYHVVIEPSWSGYCDLDVLCYTTFDFDVIVQAFEPRDARFIDAIRSNLIPVATSTNWWVDHRVMRPLDGVQKDIDLIMVASWAPFKRHYRFFHALSRLAKRGHRPRVLLIGYPYQTTRDEILRQAQYYGVDGQIEVKENLSPDEVNYEFNRSKVNVIWSRREGVNRSIIEGMFAGVPCIVRDGFNYGYRYPYVNEQTGCYATEATLPDRILEMIARAPSLRPREWVLQNMTCQIATRTIAEAIERRAHAAGEQWSRGLAVKVCHLTTMTYWNPDDGAAFATDYDYLRSCLWTSRPETEDRAALAGA